MTRELQPLSPIEARAWNAYQRARDAVAGMHAAPRSGVAAPSGYWTEELANIDYLTEATPLVIRKLRQHAFWITGLRPYDYRVQSDAKRDLFEERLRALVKLGGEELLVPEPEALGGFGYRIDDALYNIDTLKFLEVLVGMRLAGLYDELRGADRPVIAEVGGGWGGLAYQLKTLIPGATYVIVDLPELFLFSATYLATVFPRARSVFWQIDKDADDRHRYFQLVTRAPNAWRGADFVFVPHTHASAIEGMSPAAMLNVASFQEMTTAQVELYATIAARAKCPWLYSLNRECSRYNSELTSVSAVLGKYYELREIPVLEADHTKAMKKPSRKKQPGERSGPEDEASYRHLAGRLR